jgi:hypothetical protein
MTSRNEFFRHLITLLVILVALNPDTNRTRIIGFSLPDVKQLIVMALGQGNGCQYIALFL